MKEKNIPILNTYGYYSSNNYGSHCMMLNIPASRKNKHGITLYFSYETLIAFRGYIDETKQGLFVAKNTFSTTTGKHLNFISSNKNCRLNYDTFIKLFKKALKNA